MKNIDYPVGTAFVALVLTCFGAGFFVGSSTVDEALSGFILTIFSSYVFFFLTVTLKNRAEKKKGRLWGQVFHFTLSCFFTRS